MVFLVFLIFIYLPSKDAFFKIKSELSENEKQIHEIEAMISKAKSREEGIALLKERLEELNNKLPSRGEESFKVLSDLARKLNVELISIQPDTKKLFVDENNNKVEVEGMFCQVVFVSLELKCFYSELTSYIKALESDLPAFVNIETLTIEKDRALASKLNVRLGLNLYLLS